MIITPINLYFRSIKYDRESCLPANSFKFSVVMPRRLGRSQITRGAFGATPPLQFDTHFLRS